MVWNGPFLQEPVCICSGEHLTLPLRGSFAGARPSGHLGSEDDPGSHETLASEAGNQNLSKDAVSKVRTADPQPFVEQRRPG